MVNKALLQRLNHSLNDPQRTLVLGDVSRESLIAFQQGLLDLPEAALESILDSKTCFAIGNQKGLYQALSAGGAPEKDAEEYSKCFGFHSPHGSKLSKALNGKAFLVARSDINLLEIRHTTRHEAGHALDHINSNYKGYKSDAKSYHDAFKNYMAAKMHSPRTEIAYQGDRGFRHNHAPLYDRSDLELELTAEIFDKYSHLQSTKGPKDAEAYMARNYPYVWDELKREVLPQIVTSLERQGLDEKARPQGIEDSASYHDEYAVDWLKYIISQNWQNAQTVDGETISRIAVRNLDQAQRQKIISVLQEVDIHATEHVSQSLGPTIRINDTVGINRVAAIKYFSDDAEWMINKTDNGHDIARISTQDWPEGDVKIALDALEALGLTPTTPVSMSIGSTIRITGTDEIANLSELSAQLKNSLEKEKQISVSRLDWQFINKGDTPGVEVNVHDWSEDQTDQLIQQLSQLNIDDASVRPSTLQNDQNVVRVMGQSNVEMLERLFVDESVDVVANYSNEMHDQFNVANIEQPYAQRSQPEKKQIKSKLELDH